jgi:hypothetical protein
MAFSMYSLHTFSAIAATTLVIDGVFGRKLMAIFAMCFYAYTAAGIFSARHSL